MRKNKLAMMSEEELKMYRLEAREKSKRYYDSHKETLQAKRKEKLRYYKLELRQKFMDKEHEVSLEVDILNI